MQNMMKHPLITINPDMNAISRLGDVVFPTQWCGIEYEGTAYRMDHVPILLHKVVEPPKGILNDEELLTKILKEVRAIKAQNPETETKAELKARNKLSPKIEIKQRKKTKKAEVA
jgi:formylmethanofuran dehydrogenase subunit B